MKLCKKQKILASRLQQPVAARNDVIAKKIASGLSEDWTVSGPYHLYHAHPVRGESHFQCIFATLQQGWYRFVKMTEKERHK